MVKRGRKGGGERGEREIGGGCENDAGSEQTYSAERASLERDSAFDFSRLI